MRSSTLRSGEKNKEDSSNGKLLNEIKAISKALSFDKGSHRKAHVRSKSVEETHLTTQGLRDASKDSVEDKKSKWSWKSLKSLTHVRSRRFNCCFSLQVHSIEGLPPFFDNLCLVVRWKRQDEELMSHPAKVFQGIANFGEQLTHTCSVYATRNGPNGSAKYEAKHFLLYATVFGDSELDLGNHRIDLTRLLPLMLEELENEKSSGKWTTSFGLSGKAKGASMKVSFGYSVIGSNIIGPSRNQVVPSVMSFRKDSASIVKPVTEFNQHNDSSRIKRIGSLPVISSLPFISLEDINDFHEVLPVYEPELHNSVDMLNKNIVEKLNVSADCTNERLVSSRDTEPHNLCFISSVSEKESAQHEHELSEFPGVNDYSREQINLYERRDITDSLIERPNNAEIEGILQIPLEQDSESYHKVEEVDNFWDEFLMGGYCFKENNMDSRTDIMRGLKMSKIESDLTQEGYYMRSQTDFLNQENKLEDTENRKGSAISLDHVADSVASEFLDMLGIEHSPFGSHSESESESPREKLLRQFEKDSLVQGCSIFNFDIESCHMKLNPDVSSNSELVELPQDDYYASEMLSLIAEEKSELSTETVRSSAKAEALLEECGLNMEDFLDSPLRESGGFVVPGNLSYENPSHMPLLGEGLGLFFRTKNGGFLRSMNPTLFRNSRNNESLLMQVSNPVVLPAQMGSSVMEILQLFRSLGTKRLLMQANTWMPLEDIAGRSMEEILADALTDREHRKCLLLHKWDGGENALYREGSNERETFGSKSHEFNSSSNGKNIDSNIFVSLEDLVPLAMDRIEALAVTRLRMQSGISDDDARCNISSQPLRKLSTLKGKKGNIFGSLDFKRGGGLKLHDMNGVRDKVDELMALSLTLDEWKRLDSGEIDVDQTSKRISEILVAHQATCTNLSYESSKDVRKCGFLGNHFTIALIIQIHALLVNHEPVGSPMLALVQVERAFVSTNSNQTISKELFRKELREESISEEECFSLFKFIEVHTADLVKDACEDQSWQKKEAGSRWLLANGMSKKNKHHLMKPKVVLKSSFPDTNADVVHPDDGAWSIFASVHGSGIKWKAFATLIPHIRKPKHLRK